MFKMPKFISDKNKKVTLASKTFVFALLVSAMMLFVSVPAFAGENHIYDPAGYLSADEEAGLNRIAGDIAEGQNFSLGVVYLNEELDSELWDYCSEYIWETDFAYDTDGNGLLFALDNYSGTYVMYTLGSGTDIFTQSVQDEIFENMYPYYDSGDMYSFAESFLQLSFEEVAAQGSFEGLKRVVDNADLLTDSEEAAL
ncbi:MAG: TPM domain-containing protein [Firmicutes bacterium]|nr:TPM domain-containing protein [Bacillota bacterium]